MLKAENRNELNCAKVVIEVGHYRSIIELTITESAIISAFDI